MSQRHDEPVNPFTDPVARNFVFTGMAALLIVAGVQFLRGGLPAALLPLLVALLGYMTRWAMMPFLFLAIETWFLLFPFGIPFGSSSYSDIPESHFRILDMIVVGATLTYLICQFRLFGMIHQAMPADSVTKLDPPIVRSPSIIPSQEIGRVLLGVAGFILVSQLLWLIVTHIEIDFRNAFPFSVSLRTGKQPWQPRQDHEMSQSMTRFLLLAGGLGSVVVIARLVFWQWRLVKLSRDEAEMILLDTVWQETRREVNRQEKWRAAALPRPTPPTPTVAPTRKSVGCLRPVLWTMGVLVLVVVFWYMVFRLLLRIF